MKIRRNTALILGALTITSGFIASAQAADSSPAAAPSGQGEQSADQQAGLLLSSDVAFLYDATCPVDQQTVQEPRRESYLDCGAQGKDRFLILGSTGIG